MLDTLALRVLAALAIAGLLLGVGYSRGHSAAADSCKRASDAALMAAYAQGAKIGQEDATVSAAFEVVRVQKQTAYATIEKEVIREIPPDCARCSLTPNGLRLLNAAIAGHPEDAAANPGELNRVMLPPRSTPGRGLPNGDKEAGGSPSGA